MTRAMFWLSGFAFGAAIKNFTVDHDNATGALLLLLAFWMALIAHLQDRHLAAGTQDHVSPSVRGGKA